MPDNTSQNKLTLCASLRRDQVDAIAEIAESEEGGNKSRLLGKVVDEWLKARNAEGLPDAS